MDKDDFNANFVDFLDDDNESLYENLAVCDESIMQEYLESGKISEKAVTEAIKQRLIFPCFSGSALKLEGVETFLKAFTYLTKQNEPLSDFGAKVFKIETDERGQRLTHMKITGGTIKVKALIDTAEEENEKINGAYTLVTKGVVECLNLDDNKLNNKEEQK